MLPLFKARLVAALIVAGFLHSAVVAGDLPPGVPRLVDTNGHLMDIPMRFTTAAYQREVMREFLVEANAVASQLGVREDFPIVETNLIHAFISPFGYAYMSGKTGNITTSNYWYGFECGGKFSELTRTDYETICKAYVRKYSLPSNQLDTNAAFQLAIQWLMRINVDVAGLERDCIVKTEINREWALRQKGRRVTPIYDVEWMAKRKLLYHPGPIASVELFLPTRTLLSLQISDDKYLLRKALVRQNLDTLFPGKANIFTNYPTVPKDVSF